jgi:hypothetical protein
MGLAMTVALVLNAIQNPLIDSELAAGRIERAEGEIAWRWGGYVAQIPGRSLKPLLGELNLLPGKYRFYYLPRTKRLLSAERLDMRQATEQKLLKVLAREIPFSPQALEANRERRLARAQIPWLLLSLWIFVRDWRHTLGVMVGGLTLLLYISFVERSFELAWRETGKIGGLMLGVEIVYGFLSPRQIKRIINDILVGAVNKAEGVIAKEYINPFYYYIYIDLDLRFRISPTVYDALVEGPQYRVYYAPHSKIVVAIEPVDSGG